MSIIFGAHILRVTAPLRCLFSCFSYSAFILFSIGKAWIASRDFAVYYGLSLLCLCNKTALLGDR